MTNVTRYGFLMGDLCPQRDGPYVDIADYSLLLARLERMQKALKALVDETERCDKPGMWGVSVYDEAFIQAREALEEKP